MEGLTIDDLVFDDDAQGVFEPFKAGKEELENLGKAKPGVDPEKNKNKPNSEDPKGSESVAAGEKKQVQGGETPGNKEGSDSSSPKPNDTEQLYSNLATQFKANGVLPGLENTEEIKTLADLNSAMQKEVDSRLTATQRTIKEASEAGLDASAVSKQLNVVAKLKAVTDDYVSSDANLEFRKGVIAQDFLSRGYNKERAELMAQRSVDSGADVEDARLALASIIGIEEKKIADALQAAKDEENESISDIKAYLEKTKEIVPGIELSKEQLDQIYNSMTTDLGNKENAFMKSQKEDPIGSRVRLETFYFLTKGFKDFSIFANAKETDISKNIETLLRGADFTENGRINTEIPDDQGTFTLADLKDLEIE
jgi:hypothetical protein